MCYDAYMNSEKVTCAISGGGPAGIMLGFLLARAGVEVAVCEKWPDFFRDFRGDTIHPSTMELLYELGLLEEFLKLPYDKTTKIEADVGDDKITIADFTHLKVHCPFIAFMPQWDFLNFISSEAQKYPHFHLYMETEVLDVIEEQGSIKGIHVKGKDGATREIRADLVVAADGRHSTLREKMNLTPVELGAPMDVLWFKISRKKSDPAVSLGRVDQGHMMIMLDRTDYWQCGFIIPKGHAEEFKTAGVDAFKETLARLQPFLSDRTDELASWDQIKLLTVSVSRLSSWNEKGMLLIGDAAHAMSPIGGVGINLAVQDAVAAARILAPGLKAGTLTQEDLIAVQIRREFPVKVTQRLQIMIQNVLIRRILNSKGKAHIPLFLKVLKHFPYLRRIPAFLIGIGVRPEHVK